MRKRATQFGLLVAFGFVANASVLAVANAAETSPADANKASVKTSVQINNGSEATIDGTGTNLGISQQVSNDVQSLQTASIATNEETSKPAEPESTANENTAKADNQSSASPEAGLTKAQGQTAQAEALSLPIQAQTSAINAALVAMKQSHTVPTALSTVPTPAPVPAPKAPAPPLSPIGLLQQLSGILASVYVPVQVFGLSLSGGPIALAAVVKIATILVLMVLTVVLISIYILRLRRSGFNGAARSDGIVTHSILATPLEMGFIRAAVP